MPKSRVRPAPNDPILRIALDDVADDVAERVRLFRLVHATAMQLRARLDRELADQDLTTQQAALLQHVESFEHPPALGEVARVMTMSHQNVRQLVNVVVRKGLLEIRPDDHDGRVRRLVLTARHRALWRRRNPRDFAQIESWTSALSDAEVSTTVTHLMRLHLALREEP